MRYTNMKERDRVLEAIHVITHTHEVEGTDASLSGDIQRDVMEPNEKQQRFLRQLESITGDRLLTEQRGGVSDANIFAAKGCITLDGFGPFGDGDHTIHERANKQSFITRIEQVRKILMHYNQGLEKD